MAADDSPDCSECRQKRGLFPVPESGQPLIQQPCQSCRKLQKTFVDVPGRQCRPAFNRSVSCPARGGSNLNLFSCEPQVQQVILGHLLEEEGENEDAEKPEEKVKDTQIVVDNEPLPDHEHSFCQSNRHKIVVCLCILLCLLIASLLFYGISMQLTRKDHAQGHQSPLHLDPHRNVTVVPHTHHQVCSSHSQLTVDISKLGKGTENQTNLLPFTLVASSETSVGVATDGREIILKETGHYHVDIDFIMDTYSMDTEGEPPYKQTLCLNLKGRDAVCRHFFYPALMRVTQTIRVRLDVQSGQELSVSVLNLNMFFPDPTGNVLYISREFC